MISKSFVTAFVLVSFNSLFAQSGPTPFHQQGTVDPGDVSVESVEGETTRRNISWHAKPVLARDPGGSFYVGNKRTVMKLSPAGVPQWKLTFSRINSTSPEPGIASEHWQHEVLDQGAGLPLHNAWNINYGHSSTLGDPDVVDDMDIVDIQVTEDYLLIVGRVVQGSGPSVYLARFSLEGQYFWRQVTSTGITYLARPDYICVHVDEANDRILITESGENISLVSNGQYITFFTPLSHIVDIALSDGTRGAGYTLGYNGSNPEQFKNHRILKSLLLDDGRLVWIARTAETFTESPNQEDVNYRLETYDPDTRQIGYSLPYPISENEPYQPGHIRRTLADIALDDEGRVIVLSTRIVQLDGVPSERYDYFVEGFLPDATDSNMNGQTLDLLWSYSPSGEEWGDRMVLKGDTITIAGKVENYLRFPGWFLSRLDLNGALAPDLGWMNITPFDSSSYRVSAEVRDFAVDGSGNVYLTAFYEESDRDFNVLVDSTLAYVKYSNAGELQFIRPLPGFDFNDSHVPNAFGYGSSSPAQLLVAPDAPAQSQAPSYSVFGLMTSPETAVDLMEASTKKWNLLFLEQENLVAAPSRVFGTPLTQTPGFGSTVNATTVRTEGTNLQAVFSTTGTPYRIWFENLPEGMFFNQATDGNGKYVAVLNGPISAPYGTYPFTAFASDAHGTISQEFTLEHLSPTPVDVLRPGLALSGPKTTKAKKISITGVAGDDIQVASVTYRIKAGNKPFGGAKSVALSAGSQVRTFTLTVPTPKKGVYKIEFTVTDSSGKTTVKTFTSKRK